MIMSHAPVSGSLKEERRSTRTLFTPSDFTDEEIARKNDLAMAVIKDKLSICKYCGRMNDQLYHDSCGRKL
jgi:hypothetical protein